MKPLRFIALIALLLVVTSSCRETKKDPTQDVVEDVNDAMEGGDTEIKKIIPENNEDNNDSIDMVIQEEVNKIQDSTN